MVVECGHCQWCISREEPTSQEEFQKRLSECSIAYAKHMWLKHPDDARTDPIAVLFIRRVAAHQARTS